MSPLPLVYVTTRPIRVDGNVDKSTVIKNFSGGDVYYKSTENVSSASKDGSLKEGSTVSVNAPTYFVSASESRLVISENSFIDSSIKRWRTFSANAAEGSGTDTTAAASTLYIAEVDILEDTTLTGVEVLLGTIAAEVEGKYIAVALFDKSGNVVAYSNTEGTTVKTEHSKTYFPVPFATGYKASAGKYFIGVQVKEEKAKLRLIPAKSTQGNTAKKTEVTFGKLNETKITPPSTFTDVVGPIATTY